MQNTSQREIFGPLLSHGGARASYLVCAPQGIYVFSYGLSFAFGAMGSAPDVFGIHFVTLAGRIILLILRRFAKNFPAKDRDVRNRLKNLDQAQMMADKTVTLLTLSDVERIAVRKPALGGPELRIRTRSGKTRGFGLTGMATSQQAEALFGRLYPALLDRQK